MYKIFPRYGVTGNGTDTWHLDIFWGGAKKKEWAVQSVSVFKSNPTEDHSTKAQTNASRNLEYLRARAKAMKKMEELRATDPVRPADEPKPEKGIVKNGKK